MVALSEIRAVFLNGAQRSVNGKVKVRIPGPEPNLCASSSDRSQQAL